MTEHALIMYRDRGGIPLWTKVMRKEARHTQMRDRASGVHRAQCRTKRGAALSLDGGGRVSTQCVAPLEWPHGSHT